MLSATRQSVEIGTTCAAADTKCMNLRPFPPERYLQCTGAERAMTQEKTAMNWRRFVLRANALYLGVASFGGLLAWDVPAIFFGTGTEARVLGPARYAGIGFFEAHGLAFILSVLLWRRTPSRSWHLVATVAEMLLGSANLLFWEIFSVADVIAVGYGSTALHFLFAALNLAAAIRTAPQTGGQTLAHEADLGFKLPLSTRRLLLRANALFLILASSFGLLADISGRFAGVGPQAPVLGQAPHAAVGFVEAHGLALILAVLLWRGTSTRSWHLTALSIEGLLGFANIACWQYFVVSNTVAGGYVTTILHVTFAAAHAVAVIPPSLARSTYQLERGT